MKMNVTRIAIAVAAIAACAQTAAAQSTMTQAQVERRYAIRQFGNTLVGAAQHGAELMDLRVQQLDPGVFLIARTAPRAQGVVIDGHGVFFLVEIPAVDPVVAWALTNRGRDEAAIAALTGIKSFLQGISDPQQRAALDNYVLNLEKRFTRPGMQRTGAAPPATAMGMAPPATTAPRPMENPDMEYEQLVTQQLVNAMLDYSQQLGLAADEWLTIAARGSQGPLTPAVSDDSVTLTLRIKGSDLAEFRAGRITRDEARARVVIREF